MAVEIDLPAPDFVLESTKGKLSLSDFRGKWVVLITYPADFTPICQADVTSFAFRKNEFDEAKAQILGASVDTLEFHLRWIRELKETTGAEINYPLLSDPDRELTRKYNLLCRAKNVAYRGIFIINPKGLVRYAATYPLEVSRSVDETLRILKILQRG